MAQLQVRKYTKDAGDSLFAATGVKSIPADGYTLASTVTGKLKRGTPLIQGATERELTVVAAETDQVVAILADDTDTAISKAVAVYEEGEFNKYAVGRALTAASIAVTTDQLEVKARMKGIYFKDVVKTVE